MLWKIWCNHLKWREMLYLTISWCYGSKKILWIQSVLELRSINYEKMTCGEIFSIPIFVCLIDDWKGNILFHCPLDKTGRKYMWRQFTSSPTQRLIDPLKFTAYNSHCAYIVTSKLSFLIPASWVNLWQKDNCII